MSTKSNDQGRTYEYAWIMTLYEPLSPIRRTKIVCNSSYDTNERVWDAISEDKKYLYFISANAAVDVILELEPRV